MKNNLNNEVTDFLTGLKHPLINEISALRAVIIGCPIAIDENIKWNAPNYLHNGEDRVTMRIQPPTQIQLIFHRGAKKLAQPKDKIIKDNSGLLVWKENDRAIATFKNKNEIENAKSTLTEIITDWIKDCELIKLPI